MAESSTANANATEASKRLSPAISQASEDSLELHFDDHRLFSELLGQHDGHVRTVEQGLAVRIGVSGNTLKISGGHSEQALAGKPINEETAAAAADAALKDARPLSQNAYKVDVAKVAVKRAILRAAGIQVA